MNITGHISAFTFLFLERRQTDSIVYEVTLKIYTVQSKAVQRIVWTDLLLKTATRGIWKMAFLRPLIFVDEDHRRSRL